MNKTLLFLLILILPMANLFGQEKTVSGTVQDDIGDLLIGVNIVYGPGLGVITDIDVQVLIRNNNMLLLRFASHIRDYKVILTW